MPSVADPDLDTANLVNLAPDPDPGLKKLSKNKVIKIEFKWTFLN
jgi:hypothetical protein